MNREAVVATLSKRADWLARRIAEADAAGRVLAYDRIELEALREAIAMIREGAPR